MAEVVNPRTSIVRFPLDSCQWKDHSAECMSEVDAVTHAMLWRLEEESVVFLPSFFMVSQKPSVYVLVKRYQPGYVAFPAVDYKKAAFEVYVLYLQP